MDENVFIEQHGDHDTKKKHPQNDKYNTANKFSEVQKVIAFEGR